MINNNAINNSVRKYHVIIYIIKMNTDNNNNKNFILYMGVYIYIYVATDTLLGLLS